MSGPLARLAPILLLPLLTVACGQPVNLFTIEDDVSLGQQLTDEILSNPVEYPVLDPDDEADAYAHLDRVAFEILDNADVAHRDEFPWQFWLIEDPETLNAFAAPGGFVFVYTGLIEFLERNRAGMSSTFLTRLRLGPVLVDAKGVSRLYEGRVRRRDMILLVASALFAMVVMTFTSESLRVFMDGFRLWFVENIWHSITG